MISMLYLELMLLRRQKMLAIIVLLLPAWMSGTMLVISVLAPDAMPSAGLLFSQLIVFVVAFGRVGSTVISMKRYRQFEALFSLSVTPKDILIGNLLMLGMYYIYVFLVFLPIYLAGIGPIRTLMVVFLFTLLLIAAKGLACYAAMSIRRIQLIQLAEMLILFLFIFGWRYIQRIADQPYIWLVLPISLIAIAITYRMTARLSKERIILSSE